MFNFYFGTTAEAYKISPVFKRLSSHRDCKLIFSGQHVEDLSDFPFENSDLVIVPSGDRNPQSFFKFFRWAIKSFFHTYFIFRTLDGRIVVQGDTISTLIGSVAAKLTKKELLHIEAGYRSGRLHSPFPEEISRRVVSKLADVHFAPTENELNNLISEKVDMSKIVRTYGNTAIDNIFDHSVSIFKNRISFCLVTLHRTELLANKRELTRTLNALIAISKNIDVLLVADSRLLNFLSSNHFVFPDNFRVCKKLNQIKFHQLLKQARLVITDSGGVQQEMEILGTPTIIHRKVVEQVPRDNIYLTKMDTATLIQLAGNYKDLTTLPRAVADSPSDRIVHYIMAHYE